MIWRKKEVLTIASLWTFMFFVLYMKFVVKEERLEEFRRKDLEIARSKIVPPQSQNPDDEVFQRRNYVKNVNADFY